MENSRMTRVVRLLCRAQLTIPAEFRRRLGLDDQTPLELTLKEDKIEIRPVVPKPAAETTWVRELYAMFDPVRQEAQEMEEAEVDALIDEAIDEVQSQARIPHGDKELRDGPKVSGEKNELLPRRMRGV